MARKRERPDPVTELFELREVRRHDDDTAPLPVVDPGRGRWPARVLAGIAAAALIVGGGSALVTYLHRPTAASPTRIAPSTTSAPSSTTPTSTAPTDRSSTGATSTGAVPDGGVPGETTPTEPVMTEPAAPAPAPPGPGHARGPRDGGPGSAP